jgi:hypothetical protein
MIVRRSSGSRRLTLGADKAYVWCRNVAIAYFFDGNVLFEDHFVRPSGASRSGCAFNSVVMTSALESGLAHNTRKLGIFVGQ